MPRKMPPHIVLPNGMWRFVKRGSHKKSVHKTRRKVKTMAKRKKFTRHGFGGGGWKGYITPVAGGAGDIVIQKWIPVFGVGSTIAGAVMKDNVTMKMGLNKIGESLGLMLVGGNGKLGGGLL
jgi:hypothetical protein